MNEARSACFLEIIYRKFVKFQLICQFNNFVGVVEGGTARKSGVQHIFIFVLFTFT